MKLRYFGLVLTAVCGAVLLTASQASASISVLQQPVMQGTRPMPGNPDGGVAFQGTRPMPGNPDGGVAFQGTRPMPGNPDGGVAFQGTRPMPGNPDGGVE
jgi:hypothetical protein